MKHGRGRGTYHVHSTGGFCRSNLSSARLYSHSCLTDSLTQHDFLQHDVYILRFITGFIYAWPDFLSDNASRVVSPLTSYGLTISKLYLTMDGLMTDSASCRRTPFAPFAYYFSPKWSHYGLPLSKRSQYGLKWYANRLKRYANGARMASVYSRLSPSYACAYGPFSL